MAEPLVESDPGTPTVQGGAAGKVRSVPGRAAPPTPPAGTWEVFIPEQVIMPGVNDTDYARAINSRWWPHTLIINEADVYGPAGWLHSLLWCREPWCVYEYEVSGRLLAPLLGLAKFDGTILARLPQLPKTAFWYRGGKREWCHWRSCCELLASELQGHGYRPHVHQPAAVHLHDYGAP